MPLNVLRGNIPQSACSKRKLRTYKNSLCKVADKIVSLFAKQKVIFRATDSFCRCCLLYHPLSQDIYSTRVNYITRNVFGLVRTFSEAHRDKKSRSNKSGGGNCCSAIKMSEKLRENESQTRGAVKRHCEIHETSSTRTHCSDSEIIPTRCNNCVYSSQWLYSTCFG